MWLTGGMHLRPGWGARLARPCGRLAAFKCMHPEVCRAMWVYGTAQGMVHWDTLPARHCAPHWGSGCCMGPARLHSNSLLNLHNDAFYCV